MSSLRPVKISRRFSHLLVEDIDWKDAEAIQLLDSTAGTVHIQAALRHLQFKVFKWHFQEIQQLFSSI